MKAFALFVLALPALLLAADKKTEIDGTWGVTGYTVNGKDDGDRAKYVIIRADGVQTIMKDGKQWKKARYTVNNNASPKELTWTDLDGKNVGVAIYAIDGDTMKLAMVADKAKRATERPKDFAPGEGKVVATYKRVK